MICVNDTKTYINDRRNLIYINYPISLLLYYMSFFLRKKLLCVAVYAHTAVFSKYRLP